MPNKAPLRIQMVAPLKMSLVFLLFFTSAFGQEPGPGVKEADVILKIGQRTITEADLARYGAMPGQGRRTKRRVPADARSRLVDLVAERILFAEEARSLGLDQDPALRLLIQDAADQILANHYVHRHLFAAVTVSQAEVREYYEAHKQAFKQPETVHAAHILLRVGSQASAEEVRQIETRAGEIRKRLSQGEPFEKLAAEYSEDTGTKADGGDLGWFDRKGKAAAISEAAFALQPGRLSDPVRSSVGYHILKLIERKPPGFQPLEEVAAKIRPLLLREKKMAAAKAERGRLEDKYRVKIVAAPTESENRHGL